MINGVHQAKTYVNDFSSSHPNLEITPFLKRGDYVQWYGVHDEAFSNFEITRA
jgi:hypothetical protein